MSSFTFPALLNILSVSYTHLDVYKRQRVSRYNEENSNDKSTARVDISERLCVVFSSAMTSEDDGVAGTKDGTGLDSDD